MTTFKHHLGRSAALALALGAATLANTGEAHAAERRIQIDIAAQPMDRALEQLARETGSDILFTPGTVRGLRAPAINGAFDPETAVRRLLRGTNLTVTRDASGALIVRSGTAQRRSTAVAPFSELAQQEPEPESEIVVTGYFSKGVERALEVKRNADSTADAVVAADIGKLPANNIAEALQRVPGVTIVREAGEGQFISVRGLGPNFQAVTFNGMPLAYNENVRNSGQSGRQFRLQVLPAALIDSVVVTKAPTADLVDFGVGSNVDIRLINPLDRDPFIGVSAFAGYEERTDTFDPNGAISFGWHNEERSFGVVAGINYAKRRVQFDRLRNGWSNRNVPGLGTLRVPGDTQPYLEIENRERLSGVLGVQWRPSDKIEFDIDALYSQFDNENFERRLTYFIPSQIARLDPATAVVEDGRLVAGTIRGGRIRNYSEFLDQSHENLQVNATVRLSLGDWLVEPRVSYARAASGLDQPIARVQYRTADALGGDITFDFRGDVLGNASIPALFTNLDLTNPALIAFETLQVRPINSLDEDRTAVLNISRDSDLALGGLRFTTVRFGGQYTERDRDYQRRDRRAELRTGASVTGDFLRFPVPENAFDQSIERFQPWTNVDWGLFADNFVIPGEFDGINPSAFDLVANPADLRNSYAIGERIAAGYGRVDFEAALGDTPVTGNFGVRYVNIETSVVGTTVAPVVDFGGEVSTATVPFTSIANYEQWLPSFNAKVAFTDNIQLRLGVGRTMTPPSLSELRNSINTNSLTVTRIFNEGQAALANPDLNLNASAGNPNLRPYSSWNADVSFEWYFDGFGAFTAAAFYKDVTDYIAPDFETRTLAFAVRDGSTLPVDILVATPTNVGNAKITGIEVAYTNKFDFGLGLTATATYADTSLDLNPAGGGATAAGIMGISDWSYSITPFFERGPFEINVSYTYRSEYITDAGAVVTSLPTPGDVVAFFQDGFGILDAGASFRVRPNIELFAQGTNLLDQRQVSFAGTRAEFSEIHTFGRTINFGVRAQF